MTSRRSSLRGALTLLELVIVLVILAALASLVVPSAVRTASDARVDTTQTSMNEIRKVIVTRYVPEVAVVQVLPRPDDLGLDAGRQNHPQLRYLFVNPTTETDAVTFDATIHAGWRGPYVAYSTGTYDVEGTFTQDFGEAGDPAIIDAWGQPIVLDFVGTSGSAATSNELTDYVLRSAGPDAVLSTEDDIVMPLTGEGI